MLDWALEHAPGWRVWALEGTGSFAAGLAGFLGENGEQVVEVGALKRARGAKNDKIDAVHAAHQALAREQQAAPRAGGLREALRMVFATREGVLVSRTKAINQLKSLIVVAPGHLRARLCGHSLYTQLGRIEELSSKDLASIEDRITVQTLRSIAARIRLLIQQAAELEPQILELLRPHPAGLALLAEPGVGPVVAAQLLISWSHRGRVRNESAFVSLAGSAPLEASSGQRIRHRLNRVGDATSTERCAPSRSPACAATPKPAPTASVTGSASGQST